MTETDIAVVMPAYNEADGIGQFVAEIARTFSGSGLSIAVFIADDCSTDDTTAVAGAAAAASDIPLTWERNGQNGGHGPTSLAAWGLGLASGAPTVLHVDGDGQYDGAELLRVARAAEGHDGAIAVRTTRSDPWYRKALSRLLRGYVAILSGAEVVDANTPLRAYRREVLADLLGQIPEGALVPSVYLSAAGSVMELDLPTVMVHSRSRLGDQEGGTMWGSETSAIIPPRRLVAFVVDAALESWRVLVGLRGASMRSREDLERL